MEAAKADLPDGLLPHAIENAVEYDAARCGACN
jgi:hypothetical protein